MVAAIVGGFLGILVGGVLSEVGWRWVFLANVPIGLFGTVWAYLKLKEIGVRIKAKIDWLGNLAFAAGLGMILTGVTYGIKPYGALAHRAGGTPSSWRCWSGAWRYWSSSSSSRRRSRTRCSACRCSASGRSRPATPRRSSGRSGEAACSSC